VELLDRAFSIAKYLQFDDLIESLDLGTELALPEDTAGAGGTGLPAASL